MGTPWIDDVALALRRLMDESQHPTHSELDDVRLLGMKIPQDKADGEKMTKPQRLRAAFDLADAHSETAVKQLVVLIVTEMRVQSVFDHASVRRAGLIEDLRRALAGAGAILHSDGTITAGNVGPEVSTGGRATIDRLQSQLRSGNLDAGAVLGTAKDLLEATAKHLLHEHDPTARPSDMPAIVTQAMRAADLSTRPGEIGGPDPRAVAEIRGLIVKSAEIVARQRNEGGDGHGHLELSAVTPELSTYIQHITLAAVGYLLSSVDGRSAGT